MSKFRLSNLKDLSKITKELMVGLRALTFLDNFDSFEAEVTIAAATEISIRNNLNKQAKYVIIGKQTGNGLLTAGDTAWDNNYVTMKNHGAESVTATLIFLG